MLFSPPFPLQPVHCKSSLAPRAGYPCAEGGSSRRAGKAWYVPPFLWPKAIPGCPQGQGVTQLADLCLCFQHQVCNCTL